MRSSLRENIRLVDLDLEPSIDWIYDEIADDKAVTTYEYPEYETGQAMVSDNSSVLSGRTLVAERDGNENPDSASVLSGRTLTSTSHQPDSRVARPTAVNGNHDKWIKQKIAEGQNHSRRR